MEMTKILDDNADDKFLTNLERVNEEDVFLSDGDDNKREDFLVANEDKIAEEN